MLRNEVSRKINRRNVEFGRDVGYRGGSKEMDLRMVEAGGYLIYVILNLTDTAKCSRFSMDLV